MSMGDMPCVCANCKWADVREDNVQCHRHPLISVNYRFMDFDEWCGDFATAWGTREMRYDLPYPPYQKRAEADRFRSEGGNQ